MALTLTVDNFYYSIKDDNNVIFGNVEHGELCGNPYASSQTDPDLVIPSHINTNDGKEYFVTEIIQNANCQRNITQTLFIPNTVQKVGAAAFHANFNLKQVTFEENSQLTHLGYNAFLSCPSLEQLILPTTVSMIERNALGNTNLSSIIYCGSNPFSLSTIIYPKNNTAHPLNLKIFVVRGVYPIQYFGKYRVITTSECIVDPSIKEIHNTCIQKLSKSKLFIIYNLILLA